MTRLAILPLAAVTVLLSGHAFSEEPIANRFTMEKTENGFVRLDTTTGEMSLCFERDGQLVCKLAADERRAFEDALSDLSDRISALEQRPALQAPKNTPDAIPDDAELDRALGAMKKMMRGFFGMVEELREEFDDNLSDDSGSLIDPGPGPGLSPDRT